MPTHVKLRQIALIEEIQEANIEGDSDLVKTKSEELKELIESEEQ